MKLLIRNGTLCLEDRLHKGDILIENDRIRQTGENIVCSADQIIDATGCYVAPGFIDFHVHLNDRIGAYTLADDWTSGSTIAVLNGITTLISFITQKPEQSLHDAIEQSLSAAQSRSYCDYHWHLTPTRFDAALWPELQQWIERGFRTIKLYTTYRQAGIFSDYGQIERIFNQLKKSGVTFLLHCEDDVILSSTSVPPAMLTSAYAHALLRPPEAEITAIQKLTALAARFAVPLHIVHVSTVEGASIIAEEKKRSLLTAETCPHYLYLSDEHLKAPDGYSLICSPPLRSEINRQRLMEMANEGYFDFFATDHCPFTLSDKRGSDPSDIRTVPNGIPGIGALIPLIFNLNTYKLSLNIPDAVKRLSTHPAKVAGFYPRKGSLKDGADADIVIFRTDGTERKIISTLQKVYDPYRHLTTTMDIQYVFLRGRLVAQKGQLVNPSQPEGRWVWNQ